MLYILNIPIKFSVFQQSFCKKLQNINTDEDQDQYQDFTLGFNNGTAYFIHTSKRHLPNFVWIR